MSWISDLGENLKKIILIEDKIDRLLSDVCEINDTVLDHEKRLIRIETMVEMTAAKGRQPRIETDR
ncbi:MAG: hypothetical protein AAGJ73_13075 [Pseudomonadota bacterium]